jgi:PAS domain S-box-containing protein
VLDRLPLLYLATAATAAALCFGLGAGSVAHPLLGVACVAAILVGTRLNRIASPRELLLFGTAVAFLASGDLVSSLADTPPPAVDVLYLLAYPFLIAGFALLTQRPSLGIALDAALVAAALFVVGWTLLGSRHEELGHRAMSVAIAYPVLGFVLAIFVVRYFTSGRRLSRAAVLGGAGTVFLLAGDAVRSVELLTGHVHLDGLGGPLWLAAYGLWGAAALDRTGPSSRVLPAHGTRATRRRLALLATLVLVANVTLAFGHDDRAGRVVLVAGVGGISMLALARTWGLMRSNAQLLVAQRLSEQRFRETLENISLIAVSLDERGTVTFANDFLLELTGWTREEVVGHDWFARFDDDEEVRRDYFECMARSEIRPHFETTLRTRAGELRTIHWSSTLLQNDHGAAAGIVTIGEDVTEQRDAEAQLRRREEHFRSLIENASDVICVLSGDGVSLYESPAVEGVLGWKPEELIGRRNFNLHHPDDAELVRVAFDKVRAGETTPPIECRLRHKDGSWRHVETIAHLRERDGEQVMVLNYRDVTERRELEEKLLHAQKLEAVGRLAGGVAHDFNNLLTAIGGYAELLLAGLDEDDPLRSDAQEIARASARAATLTSQLLAFSRRQVLRPEVLDGGEVVAELENLFARLLGSDVELTTRAEPGCLVEADRGQLEQVITNLAVNARDAMPGGGRLSIETRTVEREGPYVEIAVSDTGSGMDAKTLEHVFEPFFTTKEKGKGTGLGLATVHGIVKQSGGDVLVWSEPGAGSTFRVLLPLATQAASAATVAPPQPQPTRGAETILLVEDEDMIRRLVRDVLAGNGYTVLDAPAGEPALELLRSHDGSVDLLLTDVVMPGLSGPKLAEIAVDERPGLRVLFMSGYTSEPEAVVGAPDTAFLAKPFAPQDLVAKVREVLEPVAA